jgi:two-component system CheB/CheR fusion protein
MKYDFRGYKKGTLQRRIERRMGLQQIDSVARYLEFLRSHPPEVDQLFKDLLIGVTSFFRDAPAFEELGAKVLAALVRGRDQDVPIRIWVPGCSTGEEAYSIAILLAEQMTVAQSSCRVQIFATDIDDDALETARAGTYPESITLDVTPQRLQRFFTRDDHRYTIAKSLRESVVFAVQNLTSDPPFSKLDLVSCRNVLIYLEPEMQEKLLSVFHFALNPGGYLFLGSAEGIGPLEELFTPVSKRLRIFRRLGLAARPPLEFPVHPLGATDAGRVGAKVSSEPTVASLADQLLLDHFAPAALVVRSTGHIVRFYGAMERYITLPKGDATLNVLTLARDALKPALRAGLHEAVRKNRQTTLEALDARREQQRATVRVTIKPLNAHRPTEPLWVILFEKVIAPARITPQKAGRGQLELVRRLEAELRATKKEQQQLVEQLESSNEELKAANEEVLSMNEELQSTNEELTTSKEELQSMNEELTTLNAQLSDKVARADDRQRRPRESARQHGYRDSVSGHRSAHQAVHDRGVAGPQPAEVRHRTTDESYRVESEQRRPAARRPHSAGHHDPSGKGSWCPGRPSVLPPRHPLSHRRQGGPGGGSDAGRCDRAEAERAGPARRAGAGRRRPPSHDAPAWTRRRERRSR